jgi:membrane-bound acyltransferase YfiQ involved in biofilm formation
MVAVLAAQEIRERVLFVLFGVKTQLFHQPMLDIEAIQFRLLIWLLLVAALVHALTLIQLAEEEALEVLFTCPVQHLSSHKLML